PQRPQCPFRSAATEARVSACASYWRGNASASPPRVNPRRPRLRLAAADRPDRRRRRDRAELRVSYRKDVTRGVLVQSGGDILLRTHPTLLWIIVREAHDARRQP